MNTTIAEADKEFAASEGVTDPAACDPVPVVAEEVKIPGPPPLCALLDEGMNIEIEKDEAARLAGKTQRFPLSPSNFGGCGRKTAIDLAEFCGLKIYPSEPFDARAKRRFSRGNDIEKSLLYQAKRYIPIQQSFTQQYLPMAKTEDGKYVIGGSIDTLFVTEESMIVDIKSKATYWSNSHTDAFQEEFANFMNMPGVVVFGENSIFIKDVYEFYQSYDKDNFTSKYFLQLNAYGCSPFAKEFMSNAFPGSQGIKACSLWFENKNNHVMAEIRFAPDQRLYDYSIQKMQDIYKWVMIDKKIAEDYPADYTLGSLACRFCPRKQVCWDDVRHPYTGPSKKWATDTGRLNNGNEIEEIYFQYKELLTKKVNCETVEEKLKVAIKNGGEHKVRMSDGAVYEIYHKKSPKPHMAIKRSK